MGCGSVANIGYSIAVSNVDPNFIPDAIGFINLAQIGGATISLAASGSIYLNEAQRDLKILLPAASASNISQALAGAGTSYYAELDPALRLAVLHVIIQSMGKVYTLIIAAGALGVVASMLMKWEKFIN